MTNPVDARRRWFGLFFLLMAGGMLIWGQTLLKPHLSGLGFVVYWMICLVLTCLALLTALLDARSVRKRLREENRELFRKTMEGLKAKEKNKSR